MTTSIEYRTLSESVLDEYFKFLVEIFPHRDDIFFRSHWFADPKRDLNSVFVAVDHDRIVSSVRIHWRDILLDGRVLPMGGIGEVSTLPSHRGMGLASGLLKSAWKQMSDRGVELSALHTRSAAPLYAKHGWQSVPLEFIDVPFSVEDLQSCTDVGPAASAAEYVFERFDMSARASEPEVDASLADLCALHAEFISSQQFNGVLSRSLPYWQGWIREATRSAGFSYYVASEQLSLQKQQRKMVASLCVRWRANRLEVADMSLAERFTSAEKKEQTPPLLACLLQLAVKDLSESGVIPKELLEQQQQRVLLLRVPLPLTHYTAWGGFGKFLSSDCVERAVDDGWMWRGSERLVERLSERHGALFFGIDMF